MKGTLFPARSENIPQEEARMAAETSYTSVAYVYQLEVGAGDAPQMSTSGLTPLPSSPVKIIGAVHISQLSF